MVVWVGAQKFSSRQSPAGFVKYNKIKDIRVHKGGCEAQIDKLGRPCGAVMMG